MFKHLSFNEFLTDRLPPIRTLRLLSACFKRSSLDSIAIVLWADPNRIERLCRHFGKGRQIYLGKNRGIAQKQAFGGIVSSLGRFENHEDAKGIISENSGGGAVPRSEAARLIIF